MQQPSGTTGQPPTRLTSVEEYKTAWDSVYNRIIQNCLVVNDEVRQFLNLYTQQKSANNNVSSAEHFNTIYKQTYNNGTKPAPVLLAFAYTFTSADATLIDQLRSNLSEGNSTTQQEKQRSSQLETLLQAIINGTSNGLNELSNRTSTPDGALQVLLNPSNVQQTAGQPSVPLLPIGTAYAPVPGPPQGLPFLSN